MINMNAKKKALLFLGCNMKNFALIGASGYIAKRHMQAVLETNNNLLMAYDINDSVGIIDSYFPNCEFFTDFESFYNHAQTLNNSSCSKLDYIIVCSPNHLHFNHISTSLRLGVNVICEKPLVPTTKLLNEIKIIEKETNKKVYNILQLRHHEATIKLKNKVAKSKNFDKFDVEITYITSRGKWYYKSWKNDPNKGFGIATNIGIHFFDMLHFIFGKSLALEVHHNNISSSSGFIELEKANVKWFLSIDENDLPNDINKDKKTYRKITVSRETLEFSKGFTDLHTVSYKNIINGRGFNVSETEKCIETVEKIRNSKIQINNKNHIHPLARIKHGI